MAEKIHVILWLVSIMIDSCVPKATVTMTETEYEAEEGQQIEIGLLRRGVAASSISVVVQVRLLIQVGGEQVIRSRFGDRIWDEMD